MKGKETSDDILAELNKIGVLPDNYDDLSDSDASSQ
jgi:hypothetical protein